MQINKQKSSLFFVNPARARGRGKKNDGSSKATWRYELQASNFPTDREFKDKFLKPQKLSLLSYPKSSSHISRGFSFLI